MNYQNLLFIAIGPLSYFAIKFVFNWCGLPASETEGLALVLSISFPIFHILWRIEEITEGE